MSADYAPVCIVGAGPAGAAAALTLARAGVRGVILVERSKWPRPKACAGGLGPRAVKWLARAGLLDELGRRAGRVTSLFFRGPSGRGARLATGGNAEMALVLPRADFDDFLVREAMRAGVEFRPETRVTDIGEHAHGVAVSTEGGVVEAQAVIVAGGATCSVRGVERPVVASVPTIMTRYARLPHNPTEMEMYFAPDVAPHYIWLFPEPGGNVNVGLMAGRHESIVGARDDRRSADSAAAAAAARLQHESSGDGAQGMASGGAQGKAAPTSLHSLFDDLLERFLGPRLTHAVQIERRQGAPIRFAESVGKVVRGRVLLAGEAAGLVNGATGEGIPYGLESGELAAQAIIAALRAPASVSVSMSAVASAATTTAVVSAGDVEIDVGALQQYQRTIRRQFRGALWLASAFRRFAGTRLFGLAGELATLAPVQRLSAVAMARFVS